MLVIAHRGASVDHPENTLAAYRGAIEQGADGVELDVRRSADGTLVLAHDEWLPDGRRILELGRADLSADVAVLPDALDVLAPLPVVNIEIKNWPEDGDFDPDEQLADAVVALLEERGELNDVRYLTSAFHLPTIQRVKELAPGAPTGWLLGLFDDPAPLIERAVEGGHQAIHPHHLLTDARFVELAHQAGLQVNTWTCDEPERLRELRDMGVDAVITNTPALAREALLA